MIKKQLANISISNIASTSVSNFQVEILFLKIYLFKLEKYMNNLYDTLNANLASNPSL